jgi:PAS domain S-box-containing protein
MLCGLILRERILFQLTENNKGFMSHAVSGFDFLDGGGEMGARIRAYDWASTPLGAPETWPQSLRVTIRLILNTRHPMFIWWGPDLIQFYNDAYRATMGPERHPGALGARGRECWAEIWPIIGPQIDHVMQDRGSTWDEDRLVPVTRHGRREDVWWTYSYGPIDLEGGVGGVLVVCNDVTAQHLTTQALKDQSQHLRQILEQAPSFMAVLRGPDHVFELTNAAYRQLIGSRDLIGRPVREAVPEAAAQNFVALLDDVYRTGSAHVGTRMPLTLQTDIGSTPKKVFLDFVYAPITDSDGRVSGIFVEGADVTQHIRTETHLRLVNEELKHRVKNTLAVVSAIAAQTLRGTSNDAALAAFHARLSAFGKAHDILTSSAWAAASVYDVVAGALAPHRTGTGRFSFSGDEITVGSKQALSLALAVHELATNAIKYGALSNELGRVGISWSQTDVAGEPTFRFVWAESGGPTVREPTQTGFGSRLIRRVLTGDFGGNVEVSYAPSGITCILTAPMERIQQAIPPTFRELES